VKKSGGAFVRVKEKELVLLAVKIYKEKNILLGPASIVCLLGFYKALEENRIHNGETILINTGEGSARAQWLEKEVKEYL
jgi:threonine dehydratase